MKNLRASIISKAVKASLLLTSLLSISTYAVTTAPTSMAVNAQVVASCVVSSATAVALTGQTFSTAGTGTGGVTIQCTSGTPYDVQLDAGAGTGATVTARVLTGATTPADTMTYGLYQDAAFTQSWGTTVGTDTLTETGNGTQQSWPVYMKILTGLGTAPAQSYADAVNVTVTY
jgi:spore coat protein U-like protein